MALKQITRTVAETRALGACVARMAKAGDVYGLIGDLGTGKTEFARGFVNELEPAANVRSPSFPILNSYDTPIFTVYHFDFYRLSSCGELNEIGFREYVDGSGVCLIEWAGMFPAELPPLVTRMITFIDKGDGTRIIEFGAGFTSHEVAVLEESHGTGSRRGCA